MDLHRRRFLAGLGALIAAPAIIKVEMLMPMRGISMPVTTGNLLTAEQITRHSIRLFMSNNSFFQNINEAYRTDFEFGSIGSELQIGLIAGA